LKYTLREILWSMKRPNETPTMRYRTAMRKNQLLKKFTCDSYDDLKRDESRDRAVP